MDQLPAIPVPPAIHQRIKALRERTEQFAAQELVLIFISSILAVLISCLLVFGVFILYFQMMSHLPSSGPSGAPVLPFKSIALGELMFMIPLGLVYLGYSAYVLFMVRGTFKARYNYAWAQLQGTSLGVLLAVEEYTGTVRSSILNSWLNRLTNPLKPYSSFEDHLEFCAAHFNSLVRLAGQPGLVRNNLVQRDFNGFRNRNLLRYQPWVYIVGGVIGLVFPYLLMFVFLFTFQGLRQLGNLGVLAAICDFLLADEISQRPDI